jgi:large subunit ribosomal protein L5
MNKIEKIVIHAGVGKLRQKDKFEEKVLPEIERELALITGQKPARRQAKKAIAGFKTRIGNIIGLQVTLRKKRMDDFMSRLNNIAFPRVKDFRGIEEKNIDKDGNLNVGFKDQFAFPEIDINESKVHFGFQVTIVPKRKKREGAVEMYKEMGVPMK